MRGSGGCPTERLARGRDKAGELRTRPGKKALLRAVAACLSGLGAWLGVGATSRPGSAYGGAQGAQKWVSFELVPQSAIPIVPAQLNGGQAYRLAIDVSVADTLLDEFIVVGSGMELTQRGETEEIDYYGSKEKVPVAYLDALKVGRVEKRGVKTLIIQGDDLGATSGIPVYGRIGRGFLEGLRLTVFYPRRLLLAEPSPEQQVPEGGVAFQPERRGLSVEVVVNDTHSARFILDPAASFTILDDKWARQRRIARKGAHRVDLGSLRVGGFLTRDVPALVQSTKQLPYGHRPAGVIGASLLREVAVTLDFPRSLLWLRAVTEDTR